MITGADEDVPGFAELTVKMELLEMAPPEFTVTVTEVGERIRFEATEAVNCVALTKVVGRAVPFQRTVEPEVNPEPFTVRVKAAPPA